MANPDITPYTELAIYDKNPQDIVDAALITLQSRLPEWVPAPTNLEMALLEAFALEVAEAIFSINRLPGVMIEILLKLYGIEKDAGQPPSNTLTFTMADNSGYTIPAGTEVSMPISDTESVSFFTDSVLVIAPSSTTGTIGATAVENLTTANGVVSTTVCQLISPVQSVDSVVTASTTANGVAPESMTDWLTRGVQRLQRLSDTLVLPDHFAQSALEQTYVVRANGVDNFNSDLGTGVPGDHPGHITVVVYGSGAVVSSPNKTALQALLSSQAIANLGVHITDPTITSVPVTATVKKIASYDTTTVQNAIISAVQVYLSPDSWQWSGTVRVNELIALISTVEGVDYVTTLTAPAANVVISATGLALVNAGAVTITMT